MTANDNTINKPMEWLLSPSKPTSSKRRGDAARANAIPPAKRTKEARPDSDSKDLARLMYQRNQLAAEVKTLTAELSAAKTALDSEEDRSTLLLITALRYRHKWLQTANTSKDTTNTRQLVITAEHHKNEAKRLATAANKERHHRMAICNDWRIQMHYDMARLHYPLLKAKLWRLARGQYGARSTMRHPFKELPHGEVIYSF